MGKRSHVKLSAITTRQKPIILDLFCGAGGAGMGLTRTGSGFEVIGVDIRAQPDYPGKVIVGDALLSSTWESVIDQAVAIWASPPCQKYSVMTPSSAKKNHPDLIGRTRDLLLATGLPYIIENVVDAPLRPDLFLCGTMFSGLRILRHRHFEIEGFSVPQPFHPPHARGAKGYYCVTGKGRQSNGFGGKPGDKRSWKAQIAKAMGVHHCDEQAGLVEMVPPAYSNYIGRALMAHLSLEVMPCGDGSNR